MVRGSPLTVTDPFHTPELKSVYVKSFNAVNVKYDP
jgi:hypothetical protein